MPSLLNEAILDEYRAIRERAAQCVFVDCNGLTVEQSQDLRNKLREQNISMNVVRNRIAKLAFDEAGYSNLGESFRGMTAVVYGADGDETVVAAKVIDSFRKEVKADTPAIKGGLFEGEVLSEERAQGLARLPSKPELQSTLAGMALSPGRRVAACIVSPAGRIAGCIKALVEKLENS